MLPPMRKPEPAGGSYMGGRAERPSEFAQYVKQLRLARGLSQRKLEMRAGLAAGQVSRWENDYAGGKFRSDSRGAIERVARELGDTEGRLLELAGLKPRSDIKVSRTRPPLRDLILSEESLSLDERRALLLALETLQSARHDRSRLRES